MCKLPIYFSAVDCKWTNWSEWGPCPHECPESNWEKTRYRRKEVTESCNGVCEGKDFETKTCSRVGDLEEEMVELRKQLLTAKEQCKSLPCINSIEPA